MTPARPPGPRPLTAHEALADATIVAIVVHGVGDHTPVDILNEAVEGAISLWGDAATTTRIEIEGLPVPKDINSFAFLTRETPEALQVLMGARKHIVLPIIWSGIRVGPDGRQRGPGHRVS